MLLVYAGADVRKVNGQGQGVAHAAAAAGCTEALRTLVKLGAEVPSPHAAAEAGHVDTVEALVELKADVRAMLSTRQVPILSCQALCILRKKGRIVLQTKCKFLGKETRSNDVIQIAGADPPRQHRRTRTGHRGPRPTPGGPVSGGEGRLHAAAARSGKRADGGSPGARAVGRAGCWGGDAAGDTAADGGAEGVPRDCEGPSGAWGVSVLERAGGLLVRLRAAHHIIAVLYGS